MEINELLRGVHCSCGKHHTCDTEYVFIENDACLHLKDLCRDMKNITLVADENTYAACGDRVEKYISDKIAKRVVFPGTPLLIPDEKAIDAVLSNVDDETDIIVGIGSGVIQDICKYCSFERKMKYFIVGTAPSMDGYASTGAAMITGGMKVTYPTHVPAAILADVEVLRNAPMDMIKSGYGDIIGKFSSLNDWKLSHVVNGEFFCQYIYDGVYDITKGIFSLADKIKERDGEAIRKLTEALVLMGIYLSFAGNSRPASGSEHHLSHYFEITGIVFGRPYFPHGTDVAFSAAITARLREMLLETGYDREYFRLGEDEYMKRLNEIYGRVAPECAALQKKCGAYTTDRHYREKEKEIKEVLSEAPGEAETLEMLKTLDFDISDYFALYGEENINHAVWYAKELKDRYTVLCMFYDIFGEKSIF